MAYRYFPAFELVKEDEAVQVNETYQTEKGNFIFKLIPENHLNPFYVIAKHIEFNSSGEIVEVVQFSGTLNRTTSIDLVPESISLLTRNSRQ